MKVQEALILRLLQNLLAVRSQSEKFESPSFSSYHPKAEVDATSIPEVVGFGLGWKLEYREKNPRNTVDQLNSTHIDQTAGAGSYQAIAHPNIDHFHHGITQETVYNY